MVQREGGQRPDPGHLPRWQRLSSWPGQWGGSTPSVAAPQMQAQKGQMGPEAMLIQDKTPRGKCMSERPCRTLQVQIPFGV